MQSKICYLDTETTGIDASEYEIIQLAMIIEIDGEVEKEFSFDIAARHPEKYQQRALDTHGVSAEKLKEGFEPEEVHMALTGLLEKYVDKFDKTDKFTPAGYNTRFDTDHLSEFFKGCNDKYYGSWFNWQVVDGLALAYILAYMGELSLPNYQLGTVAEHFKVPLLDSHNALEDIRATRLLVHKMVKYFREGGDGEMLIK